MDRSRPRLPFPAASARRSQYPAHPWPGPSLPGQGPLHSESDFPCYDDSEICSIRPVTPRFPPLSYPDLSSALQKCYPVLLPLDFVPEGEKDGLKMIKFATNNLPRIIVIVPLILSALPALSQTLPAPFTQTVRARDNASIVARIPNAPLTAANQPSTTTPPDPS